MKHLSILGATGSIGSNTLKIVEMFPEMFSVVCMTARSNIDLFSEQIKKFCPEIAVVFNENYADALKKLIGRNSKTKIMWGQSGYIEAATCDKTDMVVSAMVGSAGLVPTVEAIKAKKNIALANKETLVMAGSIVMDLVKENGVDIFPVDSEHSAIFQCISGHNFSEISKILLTASGGPFFDLPVDEFLNIKPEDALAHPTWEMGKKISIDSATMMNKGLEVIEAKHLFDVHQDFIEVVVHPESIVHSMVAYKDGAVIAQLGIPDMKTAIAYAMSYPDRLALNQPVPDFAELGSLNFKKPDHNKFKCLALAYKACDLGGSMPAVLNAANEASVSAFLNNKLAFTDIPVVNELTMNKHKIISNPCLEDIIEADSEGRKQAEKIIESLEK